MPDVQVIVNGRDADPEKFAQIEQLMGQSDIHRNARLHVYGAAQAAIMSVWEKAEAREFSQASRRHPHLEALNAERSRQGRRP